MSVLYGVPTTKRYIAWNIATNLPVTGDAANHTLTLTRDGVAVTATGTITEEGPDGQYYIDLSAADMSAYTIDVSGESTTANVRLFCGEALRTIDFGAIEADINSIFNHVKADVSIDTTTTPWALVFTDSTDGTTELYRKSLYETDGTGITSTSQIVGRQIS